MGTTYSYISSYWYATPNNIDITIKNLEQQHRKLTQKILELEKKNDALIQLAIREFKKNKINKAISLMKIKTLYEQEINKIENLLFCISTQELALNSSCTLQDSLHTIKHASSTMNALNTNIDLSKIDNTIESFNDTNDLNQEIQDTLSHHSFINNEHFTEDDLIKELKNLCNQNNGIVTLNQMPQPPQSPPNSNAILINQMPQAPQSQINPDFNTSMIKTQGELSI